MLNAEGGRDAVVLVRLLEWLNLFLVGDVEMDLLHVFFIAYVSPLAATKRFDRAEIRGSWAGGK